MTLRRRLAALLAVLLVAVLPIAASIAGDGGCADDCGAGCGCCALCSPAGNLTAPVTLRLFGEARTASAAVDAAPYQIADRAIEHVPLHFA